MSPHLLMPEQARLAALHDQAQEPALYPCRTLHPSRPVLSLQALFAARASALLFALLQVPYAPFESGAVQQDAEPVFEFQGKHAFRGIDHHWGRNQFATAGAVVDVWDHTRSEPTHSFSWGSDTVTSARFNPVRAASRPLLQGSMQVHGRACMHCCTAACRGAEEKAC